MRTDTSAGVSAYVDAASDLLLLPLAAERRSTVATTFTRIAEFAANLTAVELGDDVEIAGEFVP